LFEIVEFFVCFVVRKFAIYQEQLTGRTTMDYIGQFMDQLPSLLNQASVLIIFICAIAGLALTYAGLKVYWIGVFIAGMPWGMVLGGAVSAAVGWGEYGIIGGALAGGMASGMIAIAMTKSAVFLIGMLVGGLLAVLLEVHEPVIILLIALVCGAVAIFVYDWAIIVGTAFTGSMMLLFVTLNVISMARQGRPAVLPGDFVSYFFHIGERAYDSGSLYGVTRAAISDLLIAAFFFITGVLVQLNLGKLFRAKKPTGDEKPTTGKRIEGGEIPAAAERVNQSSLHGAAASTDSGQQDSGNGIWQISVLVGGNLHKTRFMERGALTIGRGDDVDIRVDDEMVSRSHLKLTRTDSGGLLLQDLGSGNGTWKLGKEMIKEDYPRDRDWYQMGLVQVVVRQRA
jgi:hypothetical protein